MVMRIQALWTGFVGGPGYTNFHFDTEAPSPTEVNTAAAAVRTFFDSIKSLLPSGTTIAIRSNAEVFQTAGPKIAELPVSTVPAVVLGSQTGAYAAATGAVVNWKTGLYIGGRQAVGRTFLIPMATGYQGDGSLAATTVATITGAANTYRLTTAPRPCVWGLPQVDRAAYTSTIASVLVPDRPAVLRSRR